MRVATSRISCKDPDRMDITVKSSIGHGKVLAPTWAMVMAVKAGEITWEEYSQAYFELMRRRWVKGYVGYKGNPFDPIMQLERVVLCCYCTDHTHCHRALATEVLQKIAESRGITFEIEGEIK